MGKRKVVNVRVKYIRPEYDNLKEWCKEKNNHYIGRKGVIIIDGRRYPEKQSRFANIYKVGQHGDLDSVLRKYKRYMRKN